MIKKQVVYPRDIERGVWLRPDTLEPIDWTPLNEWAFLNGVVMVEEMTREEFERRYPKNK